MSVLGLASSSSFFFFNDTATTEIYTLSLHDALPISSRSPPPPPPPPNRTSRSSAPAPDLARSEEHTSELQSRPHLVCRLLLEKKKTTATAGQLAPSEHSACPCALNARRETGVRVVRA